MQLDKSVFEEIYGIDIYEIKRIGNIMGVDKQTIERHVFPLLEMLGLEAKDTYSHTLLNEVKEWKIQKKDNGWNNTRKRYRLVKLAKARRMTSTNQYSCD